MESDAQLRHLIDGARQVVQVHAEPPQEAPLYLAWFALGYVAVLFYLAARLVH